MSTPSGTDLALLDLALTAWAADLLPDPPVNLDDHVLAVRQEAWALVERLVTADPTDDTEATVRTVLHRTAARLQALGAPDLDAALADAALAIGMAAQDSAEAALLLAAFRAGAVEVPRPTWEVSA